MIDFRALELAVNYKYKDISLLQLALTHKGFSKLNNERYEFIGDSILDCCISLTLFDFYPDITEGELTKIKAFLVSEISLVDIAKSINLGAYLILDNNEEKTGGRVKNSILADTLEAIFASIYLDSDIYQAFSCIKSLFNEKLKNARLFLYNDHKTILQEYLQKLNMPIPVYNIVDISGPKHELLFTIGCKLTELDIEVTATAKSKKEASQEVAKQILLKISEKNNNE